MSSSVTTPSTTTTIVVDNNSNSSTESGTSGVDSTPGAATLSASSSSATRPSVHAAGAPQLDSENVGDTEPGATPSLHNLRSTYSQYIFYSKYSRWMADKKRRETWPEAVNRMTTFLFDSPQVRGKISDADQILVRNAILKQEVMPAMRILMSGGPAAERENVCCYNCAYTELNSWQDFADLMYISMCGTGCGFSCRRRAIRKLDRVNPRKWTWHHCSSKQGGIETRAPLPSKAEKLIRDRLTTHYNDVMELSKNNAERKADRTLHLMQMSAGYPIGDSREGWFEAYLHHLIALSCGVTLHFNYSQIRPKGAPLKTMGGYASGPEPLRELFEFAEKIFKDASGRQLRPIEAHSLACKTGEVVVMGGVRRTALISISDLDDEDMAKAKSGNWRETNPHFACANNSAYYHDKPTRADFDREIAHIRDSYSGERGIFNRRSVKRILRKIGRDLKSAGMNPCGEILLDNGQFCNLTEVILRPHWDEEKIMEAVRIATILGTLQASLTKFQPYLQPKWKRNAERDALLGVSLTGIYEHPLLNKHEGTEGKTTSELLTKMRMTARATNTKYADMIGINRSAAITCVKPSGTVSKLCGTSSGIHPSHSPYMLSGIRVDKMEPIFGFLRDQGFYYEEEDRSFATWSREHEDEHLRDVVEWCRTEGGRTMDVLVTDPTTGKRTKRTVRGGLAIENQRRLDELSRLKEHRLELSRQFRAADEAADRFEETMKQTVRGEVKVERVGWGTRIVKTMKNALVEFHQSMEEYALMDMETESDGADDPDRTLDQEEYEKEQQKKAALQREADKKLTFDPRDVQRLKEMREKAEVLRLNHHAALTKYNEAHAAYMKYAHDGRVVFFFPRRYAGITRNDIKSPLDHLALWKLYNKHWCEHNASVTVSVKYGAKGADGAPLPTDHPDYQEDEWNAVGDWIYNNWDYVTGLTLFPYDNGMYKQAPRTEISKEQYDAICAVEPANVDWTLLAHYDLGRDNTSAGRTLACAGGSCDVVDQVDSESSKSPEMRSLLESSIDQLVDSRSASSAPNTPASKRLKRTPSPTSSPLLVK